MIDINDCWLFAGTISKEGYGRVKPNRNLSVEVHREVYRDWVGEIPKGYVIDHLCRIRRCINPDHLEPVTIGENVRRGKKYNLKTHCKKGHLYDDSNTYHWTDSTGGKHRKCRTCEKKRAELRWQNR